MLLLIGTTDKLQLVTSAAASVDVVSSYVDATLAAPPVVQGDTMNTQVAAITTAATTDVVAAPQAGESRNIKTIHARNKHATTATDVTVVFNRSATGYEMHKVNLLPGEALEYVEGIGFFKLDSIADTQQFVRKASDQTFAVTTLADVTGMGFAILANATYELEYDFIWQTATATVGVGVAINGPASPTSIQGTALIVGGNPATTIGDVGSLGFTAYDTGPVTTSAAAITTNYMARVNCIIENGGTAGTIIPRWKSETATNTTVKAGSTGTIRRLA